MNGRALALPATLAVLLTACGSKAPKAQGPPPLAVDVGRAQLHDVATFINLDGQIAPLQESILSLQQSGTVQTIAVNEGDRVSAGQVLAKIDDSTFRAQLAQAQANVAEAQATLQGSSLTSPIQNQQLESSTITAQQQLLQAQNTLATAQSAFDTAKRVYDSNVSLEREGYLASTALDQSRSSYVAAQQQLNNAKNSIALNRAAVAAAKKNQGQTGVQAQDVAAKQGALGAATAQVRLLETQIAQTTLTAPYAGIITQRLLDPGAYAGPNQPILRESQLDTVYVNANVPDEDLAYVRSGTPATFTSASLPGKTFRGTISDVNATPTSGTLSYRARIRQPNPDDRLRGGMLVSLSVRKEFHKNAVVVPRTAVFTSDQGASVYTVANGKAQAIPVVVGLETDTLSEVRAAGVRPGTVVITTRPDALQNGSVVAVTGQPQPGAGAAGAH